MHNLKSAEMFFNNNCVLTCRESVTIGNNVIFGPNVLIFDNDHNYRDSDFMHKFITKPIVIEDKFRTFFRRGIMYFISDNLFNIDFF